MKEACEKGEERRIRKLVGWLKKTTSLQCSPRSPIPPLVMAKAMKAAAAPMKAMKRKKTVTTFAKAMKAAAPMKAMKRKKTVTTFAKAMKAAAPMKAMK